MGAIEVPSTLEEAYVMGVNAEVANIQLWHHFLYQPVRSKMKISKSKVSIDTTTTLHVNEIS